MAARRWSRSRTSLLLLLLAVAVLLIWQLRRSEPPESSRAGADASGAGATAALDAIPSQPRRPIEPRTTAQLVGRCVAQENDAALGGCRITVIPWARSALRDLDPAAADWRREIAATTLADGTYRIEVEVTTGVAWTLRFDADRRASAWIGRLDEASGLHDGVHGLTSGEQRQLGVVRLAKLEEVRVLEQPEPDQSQPPEISGRVLQEDGTPAPGVRVQADGAFQGASLPSAPDGSFHLRAFGHGIAPNGALELYPEPSHPIFERAGARVATEWGRADAIVRVRRIPLGAVTVRAFEAATRAALGACEYRIRQVVPPAGRMILIHPALLRPRATTDGQVTFAGLKPARYDVLVLPADRRYRPAPSGAFDVGPQAHPTIELFCETMRPAALRVVDEGGQPIEGATTATVDPGPDPLPQEAELPPLDWRNGDTRSQNRENWRPALQIDVATTDPEGRALLLCPEPTDGLVLSVRADGFVPARVSSPRLVPGGPELPIVLQRAAALRGQVRDLEPTWSAAVELAPVARVGGASPSQTLLQVGADGSFAARGLLPGTWRARLQAGPDSMKAPRTTDGFGFAYRTKAPLVEQQLELEAGRTVEVRFDLADQLPAQLRGTAWLQNTPLAGARVDARLLVEDPSTAGGTITIRTDAQGTFTFPPLVRGEWRFEYRPREAGGPIEADQTLVLRAGERQDLRLEFPRRRLKLRVVRGGARTPVPNLRVSPGYRDVRTDADGNAVLDWLRSRDVRVRVDRQWIDVQFPFGGGEVAREVVLPE